jgi:hypothetical protein
LVYISNHKFRRDHVTMADADIEAAPTGAFGEGAPEQAAEDTPPSSYSRDTEQHFSRWRQGEPDDAGQEGTAEHAPMIDRPRPER